MSNGVNNYLNQAQKLYILSKEELNKAKELNNQEIAREASGKAWIAVTDGLRGFLITQGLQKNHLPKSERQRNDMLDQYGNEKMRFLYYSVRSQLHENAYYEGVINYRLLFESINHVKQFLDKCKNGV